MPGLPLSELIDALPAQARAFGFDAVGVAHLNLDEDLNHLQQYLQAGQHGDMAYLDRHHDLRASPAALHPGTLSVLSLRMNYLPESVPQARAVLADDQQAYISRYALGRDYHKRMRRQLARLADWLAESIAPHGYRVFCDSAPVLEKALARNAGLGWIGKNTLLLHRDAGSFFFLGEIYTDLLLPPHQAPPQDNACGACKACLSICPTQAFIGPYQLDARRCISYLTIEQRGPIPVPLRSAVGNRIFGCDDCQLVCPWNRYARVVETPDFAPRYGLDRAALLALWTWDEQTWRTRTEGMPLRRAGWSGWRRNLAVALGNSRADPEVITALENALPAADALVAEHVAWALQQQHQKAQVLPAAAPDKD